MAEPELITEAVIVDAEVTLSKVLGLFENTDFLIVTKNGKYEGEINPLILERFSGNAEKTKVLTLCKKGMKLQEDGISFEKILKLFLSNTKSYGIAVLKEKNVLGVVTRDSFSKALLIRDFELERAETIAEEETAVIAKNKMLKAKIDFLIATDEKNKVSGIITAKTLATKVNPYLHKKFRDNLPFSIKGDIRYVKVKEIMEPVETIEYSEMSKGRIEKLPLIITENGNLKGAVTFSKIFKKYISEEFVNVEVSGLKEEAFEGDSIIAEAKKFARKLGKKPSKIQLHIKSFKKGKEKREYEVNAKLFINGDIISAETLRERRHRENWSLSLAVKEALVGVEKVYLKKFKKSKYIDKELEGV